MYQITAADIGKNTLYGNITALDNKVGLVQVSTNDLNTLVSLGKDNTLSVRWTTDVANIPPSGSGDGYCFHYGYGNYATQYAIGRADRKLYVRSYASGTWSSWERLVLYSEITYESKVIEPLTGRFTARDAFRARRRGNVISFASYINTTSEIPAGEQFAYIGWDDAYGVVAFTKLDGTASYPTYVNNGKFGPERAIPAGWYVVIGTTIG